MRYSGLLLLLAFVGVLIRFAVWIGLALAIAGLLVVLRKLAGSLNRRLDGHARRRADAREKRAAIARRADEQNRLFLSGDPRGVYGDYEPFRVNPKSLVGKGY